jgi:ribose transport system substrate-binding protein
MRRTIFVAIALLALVVGVAACGGGSDSTGGDDTGSASGGASTDSSSGTVPVDVGLDEPLELPAGNVKVGFLTTALTNEYLVVTEKAIKEKAKEFGWDEPSVYDASYDPATQLDQIQNMIQADEIDAAIVLPTDGGLLCKAVSEQLPEAGIVPITIISPICDKDEVSGEESWVPGILTYVGASDNTPINKAWLEAAAELNPGPQKAAVFCGPKIGSQGKAIAKAVEEFEAENDEFDVAFQVETDYTTANALEQARALLKANPDISVVMSCYGPDVTRGVLQALKESGQAGKIPLDDIGASKFTYEQMEDGLIQMTTPLNPQLDAEEAMDALKLAQEGKEVKKYYDALAPGHPPEEPLIITKENMSEYTPVY